MDTKTLEEAVRCLLTVDGQGVEKKREALTMLLNTVSNQSKSIFDVANISFVYDTVNTVKKPIKGNVCVGEKCQ